MKVAYLRFWHILVNKQSVRFETILSWGFGSRRERTVGLSTGLKTGHLANALKDLPSGSTAGAAMVKLENPGKVEGKQLATVLGSAKAAIEKILNPAQDRLSDLKMKGKAEFQALVDEGTSHVQRAQAFAQDSRAALSLRAKMDSEDKASQEDWKKHNAKLESLVKFGEVHVDGLKHLKTRT